MRFLQRCSPTLRAQLLKAAGERWVVAKDSRSGLWGAQERARKALVHANKVTERATRPLRAAAARSAAPHDTIAHAETLEAHGAKQMGGEAAAAATRAADLGCSVLHSVALTAPTASLSREEMGMARALVVIDIQNDYFPGGRMELVGAEDASRRAGTLLGAFRASGEPLFHVQHLFETAEAPFFVPGTEGSEIHADVAPQPGERVIVKHHPNAFRDTPLHDELVRLGVDDVVLCGMMTSMCVDASARAAADLGLRTTIAGDACAAPDLRSGDEVIPGATVHKAFLAALGSLVADVRDTETLVGPSRR